MLLVGTEKDIIKILAKFKKGGSAFIASQLSITPGYAGHLCKSLLKEDYLELTPDGAYQLTSKARQALSKSGLVWDKAVIKAVAKELAKELKGESKSEFRTEIVDNVDVAKKPKAKEIKIKKGFINPAITDLEQYQCKFDKGIEAKRSPDRDIKKTLKTLKTILK